MGFVHLYSQYTLKLFKYQQYLNKSNHILKVAASVIEQQSEAIAGLAPQLNNDFEQVVDWIHTGSGVWY